MSAAIPYAIRRIRKHDFRRGDCSPVADCVKKRREKSWLDFRVVVEKEHGLGSIRKGTAYADIVAGRKAAIRPCVNDDAVGATGAETFDRPVAGSIVHDNDLNVDSGRIFAKRTDSRLRKSRIAVIDKNDRYHDFIPPERNRIGPDQIQGRAAAFARFV